jgi:RND family efflux transporter MFP subunit
MSDQLPSQPSEQPKPQRHRFKVFLLLIVLIAIGGWGINARIDAAAKLEKETNDQTIPTVAVIQASHGPMYEDVVLPATVQAWHEAPIYARTNGYLKDWVTDIGTFVKAGDLLAEIETPEIDAQLRQAEADLATAEANNQLAQTTAKRWQALLKTNSVSKQEADEKIGDAAAKEALVASARANLERLNELEGFKRVTAPFDGTITARNTDTGALINAGSGGVGQELFHIAEIGRLRVYVQVPENTMQAITPDMTAELHFMEYPQRYFTATLTRTANALDPATRTLLIELEVDNEKGELLPGSYAEAHMKLPLSNDIVHVPVNTLLFRSSGLQVATVDAENKAQLKTITIGRDYGKDVEVTSGLAPGESVIVNPPDSLANGQAVHVVPSEQKQNEAEKKDGDNKKP